jgi:modulator of FtsH protease HflC
MMGRTALAGFVIVLAAAAFVLFNAAFTVFQTQQALVLQLGEPKEVIRDAGLHFKLPFIQNVIYLDKRILDLDMPVQEVIASDQKRLVVDAFARFKISDPLRFYQSVGNEEVARSRLATVLNSSLRRILGERSFVAVVRDERPELMKQIANLVNSEAGKFGIEIVDVKIRRADLPQANSEAIFRRMQTERQREASEFRAQGQEQSQRIRSRADREVTILKAEATRDGEKLRGEGDAARNRIFAEAYGRDADFFRFYRSMQAYEASLGEDTTLVLTPDSDFFRYFRGAVGATPTQ